MRALRLGPAGEATAGPPDEWADGPADGPAAAGAAAYRELTPPEGLRDLLSCLWISVSPAAAPEPTLVLPDACSDLVWRHGGDAFLAGPDHRAWAAPAEAGSVLIGARFRPGAGGAALGFPLTEIADQRVPARDVPWLRGRMPTASLPPRLALLALIALVGGLLDERPADRAMTRAAGLLGRRDVRVEQVASTLGLSDRQLRRRCQAGAGYGPATLQRILRFRRFVSAVDAGALSDGGLAGAAIAAGYADQPHLSRECLRLSGLTPRALAQVRGGQQQP